MTDLPKKPYFTPKEVADYFNLPVKTLYNWIREGKVDAVRIGPSRNLRMKREVVEQLAQPVVS